ncbi:DUF4258 domain-containing protein [Leptobacterium flavescens]|uniref:DUF4258 domain-containing protein n=1 Tax=Leptobacterium flavescens TaxID=472055 RepID=A0A6P0UK74_9FLAO|nr:DUF4258 domain-containing protein [Leptobacterium flavescens]NER13771.1 DUF4258 domain-containing protein [Leptobacterium flavescens]
MPFLRRLGYYLGGVALGLIILAFFFRKKSTEFCYSPNCRVLKNIRSKQITYPNSDTLVIHSILKNGDVVFSKSDTKSKPCKTYVIEGKSEEKLIELKVKNCDSTAVVQEVNYLD